VGKNKYQALLYASLLESKWFGPHQVFLKDFLAMVSAHSLYKVLQAGQVTINLVNYGFTYVIFYCSHLWLLTTQLQVLFELKLITLLSRYFWTAIWSCHCMLLALSLDDLAQSTVGIKIHIFAWRKWWSGIWLLLWLLMLQVCHYVGAKLSSI